MSGWEIAAIASGAALVVYGSFVAVLVLSGRSRAAGALAGSVPDCVVLFSRLVRDPCVSRGRRVLLVGLLAYLVLPVGLVPDFIPVAGQLDDAIVAAFVLWRVLRGCEREIVAAWPGPQSSLNLILRLAGGREAPDWHREAARASGYAGEVTLAGPSKTISVEPIEPPRREPLPPEPVPAGVRPPPSSGPAPERGPDLEDQKA